MPPSDHLPEALQALAFRNGIEVRRDPDFQRDVERLLRSLTQLLQPPTQPPTPKKRESYALVLFCYPGVFYLDQLWGSDWNVEVYLDGEYIGKGTVAKGFTIERRIIVSSHEVELRHGVGRPAKKYQVVIPEMYNEETYKVHFEWDRKIADFSSKCLLKPV
jgi:hypothetical protein